MKLGYLKNKTEQKNADFKKHKANTAQDHSLKQLLGEEQNGSKEDKEVKEKSSM